MFQNLLFQEAIIQYFPTFEKIRQHEEVIVFTCGLLSDPSVNLVYAQLIDRMIGFECECSAFKFADKLLQSLYRESNNAFHRDHFQSQFVYYYGYKDFLSIRPADIKYKGNLIHCRNRLFVLSALTTEPTLGHITEHSDFINSKISVCDFDSCIINGNRKHNRILLDYVSSSTSQRCAVKISQDYFSLNLDTVILPSNFMVQLQEQVLQTSGSVLIQIRRTSLSGIKSFSLIKNTTFFLEFSLHSVDMDMKLCESLLKQIPSMTDLKLLKITPWDKDTKIYRVQGNGTFCHIPKDMCSKFLASLSHLYHLLHLDLSGNNLKGCLSNFISYSDRPLPSLKILYLSDTALNSDDVNHIIHIIESKKLPNLRQLNLDLNNFRGMNDQINRLINFAFKYYKKGLHVKLPRNLVLQYIALHSLH